MTRRDDDAPGPPAEDAPDPGGDATRSNDRPTSTREPPPDPRRIESLAVTASDVVDALEAAARRDRDIVLRVTPPFSGRMRARLRDAGIVDEAGSGVEDGVRSDLDAPSGDGHPTGNGNPHSADTSPIHIPPERFIADPPAYPTVDDTEDELRASGVPYTRERHRERHRTAVETWRAAVRERLIESVTIHTPDSDTTVSVAYLG
jgi:hypothetical protein